MRAFVSDAFLLRVLDEIEAVHGKPIRAELLKPSKPRSYSTAIAYDRNADEFIFMFSPEEPPTQQIICHELLHVCHSLDGWPDICLLYEYPDDPEFEDSIGTLLDLIQHVSMWPMLEKLGYSDESHWNRS